MPRPAPPVDVYLRRRARRRGLVAVAVVVAVVAIAALADREPARLAQWQRQPLRVVAVSEHATLTLARLDDAHAAAVTVRLAGLQPRAAADPDRLAQLEDLLLHEAVQITWQDRLPVGQPNAYVYFDDGTLLNEWLIEQGLAAAADAASAQAAAHPLHDWFASVEARARRASRGIWE